MTVEFGTFMAGVMSDPLMLAVTLLNVAVIVVNGATDAPNAIATVVSTRSMKPRPAIIMAALCNFLGLLVVSVFTSAVANTIFKMVDFGGRRSVVLRHTYVAEPFAYRRPDGRGHRCSRQLRCH